MLIPAIDLIDGQVVRLHQGDYQQQTTYEVDPQHHIQTYVEQGAQYLHLVDLSGAKNPSQRQQQLIQQLVQQFSTLSIQVGGGIRTLNDVEQLLTLGVKRVVIGSTAIRQPEQVAQWLAQYGSEKIVLALDTKMNAHGEFMLPTDGWTQESKQRLFDLLDFYHIHGARHILCTDISRDGTLTEPNFSLYEQLVIRYPQLVFQASGGVSRLHDLQHLAQVSCQHVILGRALLEQRFSLTEAITCWQNASSPV